MTSFIVANGDRTKFRGWGDEGPTWVATIFEALHFARRSDADRFCADDEDAWAILEVEEFERGRIHELLVKNNDLLTRTRKAEDALTLLDWAFCNAHGGFPMDRTNDSQILANDAMNLARGITGSSIEYRRLRCVAVLTEIRGHSVDGFPGFAETKTADEP